MSQVVNGNFIVYAELSFRLFNILGRQTSKILFEAGRKV